jgi:hypothetical protein
VVVARSLHHAIAGSADSTLSQMLTATGGGDAMALPTSREERDAVSGIEVTEKTARRTVASFDTYEEAESYVDWLATHDLPVDGLVIVGRDLRVVEEVTGPLDARRATLWGAAQGAALGALSGALFGLLFTVDGTSFLAVLAYWLVVGALIGALFGVVAYASGERRRFTSQSSLRATRYDVMADEAVATQVQEAANDRRA